MNDFEKQLMLAEELAKQHGALILPASNSKPVPEPYPLPDFAEYQQSLKQSIFNLMGVPSYLLSTPPEFGISPLMGATKWLSAMEAMFHDELAAADRIRDWFADRARYSLEVQWEQQRQFAEIETEFIARVRPYFRVWV